ncbi:type IV secretory system conjugative DNA transfer family protein [Nocardiopsis changdeensis]|uniref:type IV secretory system conjugative DNA transfer family protein n=1 Tax=Nocardiopsis changdeensis TaxID=2831969 RepID=UPI003F46458B
MIITLNLPLLAVTAACAAVLWTALLLTARLARTLFLARNARLLEIHTPPQTTLDHAAAFWTHTLGLIQPRWYHRLLPPHLAWEYIASATEIRIRLWVPGTVNAHAVARAVAADWPGATTHLTPATTALPTGTRTLGRWIGMARADHYPLRTRFTDDPLRNLLGELADLSPGQHALVRICARPASPRRATTARTAAARLRGLHPGLFTEPRTRTTVPPGITDDVRAILTKASAPRLACQISCHLTTERTGEQAKRRLRARAHGITASLAAYTSGLNALTRRWMPFPGLWANHRHLARGYLLSTTELAAIAHLPTDTAVPGLIRAAARTLAPSPHLPRTGRILGDSDAGPARPLAIGIAEARHHTHILGKTGSGKSTLLAHMVLQDAHAERSALVIDPRDDLILDILDRLPKSAAGRTVVFDPAAPTPPPRLNPLALGAPDLAADTVAGIFQRIHADSWGPRTDDIARAALLTLARTGDPNANLGDIPRLLADTAFRHRALTAARPPRPLADFWSWYERQSPQMQAAATDPLLNKLRTVLLRPWAGAVLASGAATLDLPHLLDHGGLILMRLPKGHLGENTTALIGTFALAAAWHAITGRSAVPESRRRDTCVYLDEAATFLHLPGSLSDMLAEARGYRAAMVLAHQELGQLPARVRAAVDANCRTKVFFNASPADAAHLHQHTQPHLNDYDLSHLGAYQAVLRTLHGATELPPATLRTRPLPSAVRRRAHHIRKASRRFNAPPVRVTRTDPRHAKGEDERR